MGASSGVDNLGAGTDDDRCVRYKGRGGSGAGGPRSKLRQPLLLPPPPLLGLTYALAQGPEDKVLYKYYNIIVDVTHLYQ